jgi:predicted MFS family arabinose efflux permease
MNPFATLKNAYSGISKPVWWLALAMLINRCGTMVIFFMSIYLRHELHFSLGQTGVVMAMFGAGAFCGVFVGGRITDRIGYYPVMVFSLLAGGLLFLGVSQLRSYFSLCTGVFILSAVGEAFRPANLAAISYYSTAQNYTRSNSLNRLAINLGFSIGPAVGGFLAMHSYKLIFWADGFTCLAAAIVVFIFVENRMKEKQAEKKTSAHSPYNDKPYLFFLPLAMLYAISFFQFFSTMPLYYVQVEKLSESKIGWIMALNGILVATIEMVMIYKIEKRWSMYNFMALGALLLLISYITLLFVNGFLWLAVITVIISFSEMFAMPFMNTYMNSRSESNKGQYASLYVMSWSAAQVFTPVIATQVIAHGGYNMLWLVLGSFSAFFLIGIKMLERMSAPVVVKM